VPSQNRTRNKVKELWEDNITKSSNGNRRVSYLQTQKNAGQGKKSRRRRKVEASGKIESCSNFWAVFLFAQQSRPAYQSRRAKFDFLKDNFSADFFPSIGFRLKHPPRSLTADKLPRIFFGCASTLFF